MKNRAQIMKLNLNDENEILVKKLQKEICRMQEKYLDQDENKLRDIINKIREIILGLSPKDLYYKLKDIPE